MNDPLVSIIMPVKESELLVAGAIRCVQKQTREDWELIIVDGHSSDGTLYQISLYQSNDPRIKLITQPGKGIADARNAGVVEARGKFVSFLDSDDRWEPNKLCCAVNNGPFNCHDMYVIDWSGIFQSGYIKAPKKHYTQMDILWENPAACSSVTVERELLNAAGEFRGEGCEDWDMWIRVAGFTDLLSIHEPLGQYRNSLGSLSSDLEKMDRDRIAVIDRVAGELSLEPKFVKKLKKRHYEKMVRMYFGQRNWNGTEDAFDNASKHGIASLGAWARALVAIAKWGTA
jgi:hypothetical protein